MMSTMTEPHMNMFKQQRTNVFVEPTNHILDVEKKHSLEGHRGSLAWERHYRLDPHSDSLSYIIMDHWITSLGWTTG